MVSVPVGVFGPSTGHNRLLERPVHGGRVRIKQKISSGLTAHKYRTYSRPIPDPPSVRRPIADPIVTTIPPGRPNLSPLRSSPLLLARLSPSSSQAQQQQWMECGPDKETPRVGVTRRCCRAFFQITLFNSGDPRRNRQPGPVCVAFVWVLIGGAEFAFS